MALSLFAIRHSLLAPRPLPLLDDLIGTCQEHGRHFETKVLCGFQIDDEFEPDRLDNRQIGRLGALENLPGVIADLAISGRKVDTVTHEAASRHVLAELVDSRQSMLG